MQTELTQCRSVQCAALKKTWPRWPSHFAHLHSVPNMKLRKLPFSSLTLSSTGSQNEGQPVPLSNLAVAENRGWPPAAHAHAQHRTRRAMGAVKEGGFGFVALAERQADAYFRLDDVVPGGLLSGDDGATPELKGHGLTSTG